ncbi:fimbria/pilus outer membrane usher protein, partial [Salmonella enterica]|uniref:fimbria/pilus outer membrane usher protein n=1 Tax=Salmonella enterica TaxID=28901 RepID=UPI0020C2B9BD
NLIYNIQQGYQNLGIGVSGADSLDYDVAKGIANIGYNVSDNGYYQQVNYVLIGGLVAHAHGVTLSQPLGNTNIFIAAPC